MIPLPDLIKSMREALQPKGTAPLVRIGFLNSTLSNCCFMDLKFVQDCIDEVERMEARVLVGDKPTKLELLAIELLCSSAYIDTRSLK